VKVRRGGEGRPSWGTVRETRLTADLDDDSAHVDDLLERSMAAAARVGLTTQRLLRLLDALSLREAAGRLVPQTVVEAGAEHVDFRASTGYLRSRSELGVRINLEGREPEGAVPPEAYEDVRSDLVELLSSVTTPDGDRVFEDVARREKYFHGPMVEDAVEVVTVPKGFEQLLSARVGRDTFGPPAEPWNHKREGVVAATGAAIDPDAALADATIFDVAPTLLATFDLPTAERMDGRCLPIIDSSGEERYEPYTPPPVEGTGGARDPRVVSQRSDRGYL
jgi:predicted AlkP superfamily phosphohydrolase/phosphomutase